MAEPSDNTEEDRDVFRMIICMKGAKHYEGIVNKQQH
jgi:hypothetical protein